jgi:hypothetical protein
MRMNSFSCKKLHRIFKNYDFNLRFTTEEGLMIVNLICTRIYIFFRLTVLYANYYRCNSWNCDEYIYKHFCVHFRIFDLSKDNLSFKCHIQIHIISIFLQYDMYFYSFTENTRSPMKFISSFICLTIIIWKTREKLNYQCASH